MKKFVIYFLTAIAINGCTQKVDQEFLLRLIDLRKNDPNAYIKEINGHDYYEFPADFIFELGEIQFEKGNLQEARKAYEYVFYNRNIMKPFPTRNEKYISFRTAYIDTEVTRNLRETYILLEMYEQALRLIDREAVTYEDISANGSCANPWIESRANIDYARCHLGLGDSLKALDYLFWDNCFFLQCFDYPNHIKTLKQLKDSTEVEREIYFAFNNPICVALPSEGSTTGDTYLNMALNIFDDTILTPFILIEYENCIDIPESVLDSITAECKDTYYYERLFNGREMNL